MLYQSLPALCACGAAYISQSLSSERVCARTHACRRVYVCVYDMYTFIYTKHTLCLCVSRCVSVPPLLACPRRAAASLPHARATQDDPCPRPRGVARPARAEQLLLFPTARGQAVLEAAGRRGQWGLSQLQEISPPPRLQHRPELGPGGRRAAPCRGADAVRCVHPGSPVALAARPRG